MLIKKWVVVPLFFGIICEAGLGATTQPSAHLMPRAEIVARLQKSIQFSDGVEQIEALKDAAYSMLRKQASLLLPGEIPLTDLDSIDLFLNAPLRFEYSDSSYMELRIKERLMQIKIASGWQMLLPPMSKSDSQKIHRQMVDFFGSMQKAMVNELVGPRPKFTQEEVESYMRHVQQGQMRHAMNPNTTWYTEPMDEAKLESLKGSFAKRLHDTADRASKRLSELDWSSKDPDTLARISSEQREILDEVVEPAVQAFQHASTDPRRLINRDEEFSPGYLKVEAELQSIEHSLRGRSERSKESK